MDRARRYCLRVPTRPLIPGRGGVQWQNCLPRLQKQSPYRGGSKRGVPAVPQVNEATGRALGFADCVDFTKCRRIAPSFILRLLLFMPRFRVASLLVLIVVGPCIAGAQSGWAQSVRVGAGGGVAVPTSNVEARAQSGTGTLDVDLKPGPQAYVGAGFVRSLGDRFALGARVRAQASRLGSEVDACDDGACSDLEGRLRAVTVEGRLFFTSPDWINPYFLVGLGVVNVTVDPVTVDPVTVSSTGTTYEEISVTDAGGDVGLGASVPVAGGLFADVEVRATGALPGGKDNAVTAIPFTLGLSYQFE